jgi:hypothetical protein
LSISKFNSSVDCIRQSFAYIRLPYVSRIRQLDTDIMALEGRKRVIEATPRAAVLRRSFWAHRQLDMFVSAPQGATARSSALEPYVHHLDHLRANRDQEARS